MRWLDRVVGASLCRLLAPWVPARRHGAPPRRVLFVQLAESGSMILADPAMAAAEAAGAVPYVLTFARHAPTLALVGRVPPARIFALRADSLWTLLADTGRWLRWVRRQRIDAIVDLELLTHLSALLVAASGVGRGTGFARADGGGPYAGRRDMSTLACNPYRHMSDNYRRLVDALTGAALHPVPAVAVAMAAPLARHDVPAAARRRVGEALRAVGADPQAAQRILVNANASDLLPQRRWPAERFAQLVRALLAARPQAQVELIGAGEDAAVTAAIAATVGHARCHDLAGRVALADLPALFAGADVLVSNDSGPAHFAAVAALPVVVLFGPETPVRYRPLGPATVIAADLPCSPCVTAENQRRTTCADNRCMHAIGVDRVLAATLAWLVADASAPAATVVALPHRRRAAR